ncbi:hypothetical protein GCM10011348_07700 [Marinobacterium nitratireducens]|uniref:Uncharacterized protein n=1 Tax=Marinobacterium nitratireducens TaxID=518897 RepID=A0A917Z7Z7_9GAMM|nr:hypothetical protein [Marinobacterium nitratireducens]GGO77653.1 hypothetical protein GCM10011348_07700 [Marinobacterium nitratireducens]
MDEIKPPICHFSEPFSHASAAVGRGRYKWVRTSLYTVSFNASTEPEEFIGSIVANTGDCTGFSDLCKTDLAASCYLLIDASVEVSR